VEILPPVESGFLAFVLSVRTGMDLVYRLELRAFVGSIPTRSTILSITYRGPPFQLGVIWRQMRKLSNSHGHRAELVGGSALFHIGAEFELIEKQGG
jgi:hypothetical protein